MGRDEWTGPEQRVWRSRSRTFFYRRRLWGTADGDARPFLGLEHAGRPVRNQLDVCRSLRRQHDPLVGCHHSELRCLGLVRRNYLDFDLRSDANSDRRLDESRHRNAHTCADVDCHRIKNRCVASSFLRSECSFAADLCRQSRSPSPPRPPLLRFLSSCHRAHQAIATLQTRFSSTSARRVANSPTSRSASSS